MNTILYYDRNGNPVFNPATLARMAQTGNAPANAIAAPPDCFCGDNRNYQIPSKFTLRADNTGGGGAATFKMQPFDMMAEAIAGSIGTAFFQLVQAINGNGTIPLQNGTFIFGLDALRSLTATYALVVSKMEATGSYVTGLSLSTFDMNVVKGNLNDVSRETRVFSLDKNYQQRVLSNNDTWLLTANKGFSVANIPNGANGLLEIEFTIAGFKPYTEIL